MSAKGAGSVMDTAGLPISVIDAGGWALAVSLMVLIITAFIRGWVHPGSTVETFRKAWEVSQAANAEKDLALTELTQHARVTVKILESLQNAQREGGDDDEG